VNNLTQYISSTKYHLGKNPEKDVLDNIPRNTKDDLLEVTSPRLLLICILLFYSIHEMD
jgi:hypothetical protein